MFCLSLFLFVSILKSHFRFSREFFGPHDSPYALATSALTKRPQGAERKHCFPTLYTPYISAIDRSPDFCLRLRFSGFFSKNFSIFSLSFASLYRPGFVLTSKNAISPPSSSSHTKSISSDPLLFVPLKFDIAPVLEDKSKPKPEKAVVDLVMAVLPRRLIENRLLLRY